MSNQDETRQPLLNNADPVGAWSLDFFDCRTAKTPDGKQMCFPTFCPIIMCCKCLLTGQNVTMLEQEPYMCEGNECWANYIRLGDKGCKRCCLTCPLGVISQDVCCPCFGCYLYWQRGKIMEKYNIPGGRKEQCKAFCFQCALLQQNHLLLWKGLGKPPAAGDDKNDPDKAKQVKAPAEEVMKD